MMLATSLLAVLLLTPLGFAQQQQEEWTPPLIHYTIKRRGGAFAPNWVANLTHLAAELRIAESRFNFTRREVKGNKVVRVPKERAFGGAEVQKMMGEFGREGNWFADLKLGEEPQTVELDLDMLTADFHITTTSSTSGSRFEDFFSKSYQENKGKHPFPTCELPTENFHLPMMINQTVPIPFTHCKPRRQSVDTLGPNGATFGLAPSKSLSQISDLPSFIELLLKGDYISEEVFSLTLINGEEGLLTIGGTIAEAVARVETKIESFLGPKEQVPLEAKHAAEEVNDASQNKADAASGATGNMLDSGHAAGAKGVQKRDLGDASGPEPEPAPAKDKRQLDRDGPLPDSQAQKVPAYEKASVPRARAKPEFHHLPTWRDEWKWSPVEGAAGWWQILMRGIWVDHVKTMKNQPCIVDLNTPFILAPPLAAKTFYAGIPGAYKLGRMKATWKLRNETTGEEIGDIEEDEEHDYSNFYAYPCNNPPFLHLEFGGWRYPVMRGTKSPWEHRGANGKFSLGKVADDSGYCIGAVVETRMGVGDASPVKSRRRAAEEAGEKGMAGGLRQDPVLAAAVGAGIESSQLAGNGLRDVWVLGEPIFRGLGLVFDLRTKEVGFRTY